jgi:hypothetical protein
MEGITLRYKDEDGDTKLGCLGTCQMKSSKTAVPTVASSWSTFKDGVFYLVVEKLSCTSREMAARSSTNS